MATRLYDRGKTEHLLDVVLKNQHDQLQSELSETDARLVCVKNQEGEQESLVGRLLIAACDKGHLQSARILLKYVNSEIINSFFRYEPEGFLASNVRWTSLHVSAARGFTDLCEILSEHEAAVASKEPDEGFQPLGIAAWYGHLSSVKCLAEHGAGISCVTKYGLTPAHIAAKRGQLNVMEWLVQKDPELLSTKNNEGDIPIHLAAEDGRLRMVKWLTENSSEQTSAKSKTGHTPAHCAAEYGHLEIVMWLTQVDPDQISAKTLKGSTPTHIAAECGHLNVVKWLVDKDAAQISAKKNSGVTAIHVATEFGHLDVVKWIAEREPELMSVGEQDGYTASIVAAHCGQLHVLKWLVGKDVTLLSAKTVKGLTAAHSAAECGNLDVVKWLGDMDSDQLSVKTYNGLTPTHVAAENDQLHVLVWLADKNGDHVSATTNSGHTATHIAAANGHLRVLEWLHAREPGLLSITTNEGSTPTHLAAEKGHLRVLKWLATKDLDQISVKLTDGDTALDSACYFNEKECVQFLLDCVWSHLSHDEATEITGHAEKVAKQENASECATLLSMTLARNASSCEGFEEPTELVANMSGPEGSGKTTLVRSMSTTVRWKQLIRLEGKRDTKATDFSTRTKGIEESDYTDPVSGHILHLRDMAGQEHFSTTHDLFSLATDAPTVGLIVTDGTQAVEQIRKEVSSTAASYVSRLRLDDADHDVPGSDLTKKRLAVGIVTTRADQMASPLAERAVETSVREALDPYEEFLQVHFNLSVDSRKSADRRMEAFREGVRAMAKHVLKTSPRQPRLLRIARKVLAKVQALLKVPFSTKPEFLDAFVKALYIPGEHRDHVVTGVTQKMDAYLKILTAYGYVITFDSPSLSDIVVNKPSWLLQDVVGMVFSPQHFPPPHADFSHGRMKAAAMVAVLNTSKQLPGQGGLLLGMVLQLGLLIQYEDLLVAPALLDPAPSPLGNVSPSASMVIGSEYRCQSSAPFSSAVVVQVQTHLHDYFGHHHRTKALMFRRVVMVTALNSSVAACVSFTPDHLLCLLVVSGKQSQRRLLHSLHQLLQQLVSGLAHRYSPGTVPVRRPLSVSSIRQQMSEFTTTGTGTGNGTIVSTTANAGDSFCPLLEAHQPDQIRAAINNGNDVCTASGVHSDDPVELLHLPATHATLLSQHTTTALEGIADDDFIHDLADRLSVSEQDLRCVRQGASDVDLHAQHVVQAWARKSYRHTSTELYRQLLPSTGVHAGLYKEICSLLRSDEAGLSAGFPDIFYSEHQHYLQQEEKDLQLAGVAAPSSTTGTDDGEKKSFLGQTPRHGGLKAHLQEMMVRPLLIADLSTPAYGSAVEATMAADATVQIKAISASAAALPDGTASAGAAASAGVAEATTTGAAPETTTVDYSSRLLEDVDDLGALAVTLGNALIDTARQNLGKEAVRLTGGKVNNAAATLNQFLRDRQDEIEGPLDIINVHVVLKFLVMNKPRITLRELDELLTHRKVAPHSSKAFQAALSADDLFED